TQHVTLHTTLISKPYLTISHAHDRKTRRRKSRGRRTRKAKEEEKRMHRENHHRPARIAGALFLAGLGLSSWPTAGQAQTTASSASGQASAAQVVLLGLLGTATSSSLASTGITGTNAESDVGQLTGSIPAVLSGEVLNAAAYSYADEVDSMASM